MSIKKEIADYVEHRLVEWANWYLRHNDLGLGYPKKTTEGRLIDEGGLLIRSTTPLSVLSNPEAEEIEQLVVELAQQNFRLAEVLREHYFGQGTAEAKAKRLGMSYAPFKIRLDMAKQWMTGRLSAAWRQCRNSYQRNLAV